eukprot:314487-Amorphochlora_amoeboformis.AAC.1
MCGVHLHTSHAYKGLTYRLSGIGRMGVLTVKTWGVLTVKTWDVLTELKVERDVEEKRHPRKTVKTWDVLAVNVCGNMWGVFAGLQRS